jgi:hypothetical protein
VEVCEQATSPGWGDVALGVHTRKSTLSRILPMLRPDDAVLVMDADSTLAPEFLAVADGLLADDVGLGAVGGVVLGTPQPGLVG